MALQVHFRGGDHTACGVSEFQAGPPLASSGEWRHVTCVDCLRVSVEPGSPISRGMARPSIRSSGPRSTAESLLSVLS
jgi:hypothetical protein